MTAYYRRNLPHIHPSEAIFFVTFRLSGSLPLEVIEQLRQEFQEEERRAAVGLSGPALLMERYKIQKKFFGRYDNYLDQMAHGPTWLREPVIAGMVAEEIQRLHGAHYDLLAYCIMPNHVHLLADCRRFDDAQRDKKRPSVGAEPRAVSAQRPHGSVCQPASGTQRKILVG